MADFNARFDFFIGSTTQTGNQLDVNDVIQDHVVPALADHGIDGFTATQGVGFWKGQRKDCLIVTLFANQLFASIFVAFRLAKELDQETVLVSATRVYADLIGS